MKFIFDLTKRLLSHWVSKLLGADAATEIILTVAKAHARNSKTETDDKIVAVLEKHLKRKQPPFS